MLPFIDTAFSMSAKLVQNFVEIGLVVTKNFFSITFINAHLLFYHYLPLEYVVYINQTNVKSPLIYVCAM